MKKQKLKPIPKNPITKILKRIDKLNDDLLTYEDLFTDNVKEIYDLAGADTNQLVSTVESLSKSRNSRNCSLVLVLIKGKVRC